VPGRFDGIEVALLPKAARVFDTALADRPVDVRDI
jgi:hypothetical protein